MPNPKKFDNKSDWMDSCMHQLRKVENKDQQQSVAICLNMWRDKDKKKKLAHRVASAFIEASINVDLKRRPPMSEALRSRSRQQKEQGVKNVPGEQGGDVKFVKNEKEPVTHLRKQGPEVVGPYGIRKKLDKKW